MSLFTIAGIGEALFDCYPDGRRLLGGAPFDFAVQAHRIATRFGGRAVPVTRIGDDELGRELLAALPASAEAIQIDPVHPTGVVRVTVDNGEPTYDIAETVAWDFIDFQPLACDAVCFGTLAQRHPHSRASIQHFVAATRPTTLRLFDVNLRQRYWNREVIEQSLALANAVKLNLDEMTIVSEMFHLPSPAAMLAHFSLDIVVLTKGELGAALYTAGEMFQAAPIRHERAPDADAVGAGDAFAGAVVVGLLCKWPLDHVVTLANRAGAYVASQRGALPPLPDFVFRSEQSNET